VFTNDTLAKILVDDRHRDIRARTPLRRRETAIRRWARAVRHSD
jgi:hypothetical protein